MTADRSLQQLALTGDEAAFERLIEPLTAPALRLAYSQLRDVGEAEDAVQESVLRAWRKLSQLREGKPMRPWFFAIVVNQCRNMRRTRWFSILRVADIFRPSPSLDPLHEKLDIQRGLARLPNSDREALFMYFYLDLPLEEVAQALGISTTAAKGRIYRACHRLRPGLLQEDL